MQYFVRAGSLTGFEELVQQHHQNPVELLTQVGLGSAVLEDPDLYISYLALAKLLELAAAQCGQPDFGLQLGLKQGLEVLGALGPALCLQATVADALAIMRKNLDFHAKGVHIDSTFDTQWIDLTLRFDFEHLQNCAQLTALSMTLLTRGVAQLHGQEDGPELVCLKIPEAGQASRYENGLACKVLLDQTENRVRYPLYGLNLPIKIDEALRARLGHQWRTVGGAKLEIQLAKQVQRAITALLPTGECSLELVARVLDLHPRSLQMRLQATGSSFGELLQQTRHRLACEHLSRSNMDLTTLAMNLGYSEQAVFSRSFKKWTGLQPSRWRKNRHAIEQVDILTHFE